VTDLGGFDLLRDTLAIAVPLRIMEVKDMPAWERDALATWAASQFTHADVMLYKPSAKQGQKSAKASKLRFASKSIVITP
jgi:hypothetical protein